ncbi:SEC-C metal-binding domain-containing protein [Clostridium algidicarnis]|uniref:SEC-C metal-binding domain-containing protein n=1 Tax=Clostridium algidicarnis TaxID=37659 RepID=UPI0004981D5E|nr:SEC-C metal-binding domain-containing protein [Clostridium algidicarnis]
MNLYKRWTDMVVEYVKHHGEEAFWDKYSDIERRIYIKILASHKDTLSTTISDLAKEFETTPEFVMGFVDGINESLVQSIDLETISEDSEIEFKIDFEKLYFNMLDAKADYLYELSQWEGIFSKEKRTEIHKAWKSSKTVVNENKVGRNDPCICGSGKKYKKCCGK